MNQIAPGKTQCHTEAERKWEVMNILFNLEEKQSLQPGFETEVNV